LARESKDLVFRLTLTTGAVLELDTGDITHESSDAIVNAANSSLLGGGGVDGAIHRAGGPAILEDCKKLRSTQYPDGLPTGQAVATTGGKLKARYVIHTVGPVYSGSPRDPELLASCYRESLRLADDLRLASISFPSISTGAYGYPMDQAARIALAATLDALTTAKNVSMARLVLFGEHAYDAHVRAAKEVVQERRDVALDATGET
jgi:O-acetyl-ADP-ribose deacetylase (regulator of RNase III)